MSDTPTPERDGCCWSCAVKQGGVHADGCRAAEVAAKSRPAAPPASASVHDAAVSACTTAETRENSNESLRTILTASARTVTRYWGHNVSPNPDGTGSPAFALAAVVLSAEVAPLLTALAEAEAWRDTRHAYQVFKITHYKLAVAEALLAEHAQAVQTLATALRAIHAHPTYALDQILAVADRLDALAAQETP